MKRVAARRLTAMLMAMVMALSLLPVTALAVGTDTVFDAEGNLLRECGVWIAGRCEGTTLCRGFLESDQGNVEVFCDANGSELVYLTAPDTDKLTVKKTADNADVSVQEVGKATMQEEREGNTVDVAGTVYTLAAPSETTTYTVTRADNNGNYPESFQLTLDRSPVLGEGQSVGEWGVSVFTGRTADGMLLSDRDAIARSGGSDLTVALGLLSQETKYLYFGVDRNDTVKVGDDTLTECIGLWKESWYDEVNERGGVELRRVFAFAVPDQGETYTVTHLNVYGNECGSFQLTLDRSPVLDGDDRFDMMGVRIFTGLENGVLRCDERAVMQRGDVLTVVPALLSPGSKYLYFAVYGNDTVTVYGQELTDSVGLWRRHWHNEEDGQSGVELCRVYRLAIP